MKRKMMKTLQEWKGTPDKVGLVVTGARQVGKTYIIEQFARENYENYLKIDFSDSSSPQRMFKELDADRIYREIANRHPNFRMEEGKSLLFLDEIQNCAKARSAIKPLVKDGLLDIIASGSMLGVNGLKRSEDEGRFERLEERDETEEREGDPSGGSRPPVSPMGYETKVRMHPMDFEEYLWAIGYSEEQTSDIRRHVAERQPFTDATLEALFGYYRDYVIVGGMPKVVLTSLSSPSSMFAMQKEIMQGYDKDVLDYAPDGIKISTRACMNAIVENMRRSSMKVSYTDIEGRKNVGWREYADPLTWLDASGTVAVCNGLTEPVRPLRFNIGRSFRMYMSDTGVLMARIGEDDRDAVLMGRKGINVGCLTENVVANMLERCGLDLYYFERDKRNEEERSVDRIQVDFVATLGADLAAIEVKSGENRKSDSLNKLMTDPRYAMYSFDRFIKLETRNIFTDERGVEHYPLFAAAFADSMGTRPELELSGYRELELRSERGPEAPSPVRSCRGPAPGRR